MSISPLKFPERLLMVASRCLLGLKQLLFHLLGLNGRHDLCTLCKAFHSLKWLFAVEQPGP
jgi:hypothetical protein